LNNNEHKTKRSRRYKAKDLRSLKFIPINSSILKGKRYSDARCKEDESHHGSAVFKGYFISLS